jgi:hypothetical protein
MFVFPSSRDKLSVWDIACRHTGQNATEKVPTNETRDVLLGLVRDVTNGRLWVEFGPGADFDFLTGVVPALLANRLELDWHQLHLVTVRREDWLRYQASRDDIAPEEPHAVGVIADHARGISGDGAAAKGSEQSAAPDNDSNRRPDVWKMKAKLRGDGLRDALFNYLSGADKTSARPTARKVLNDWAKSTPPEIARVHAHGVDYPSENGDDERSANIRQIRERIAGLTEQLPTRNEPR